MMISAVAREAVQQALLLLERGASMQPAGDKRRRNQQHLQPASDMGTMDQGSSSNVGSCSVHLSEPVGQPEQTTRVVHQEKHCQNPQHDAMVSTSQGSGKVG